MKVLIHFFNAYLIVLSMLTCKDQEELPVQQPSVKIEAVQRNSDHHPEDACAPFCSCACCSVTKTIPGSTLILEQLNSIVPVTFSEYKVSFPKEISLSVWQPPQLAA